MSQATADKIQKLPRWVQDHIQRLEGKLEQKDEEIREYQAELAKESYGKHPWARLDDGLMHGDCAPMRDPAYVAVNHTDDWANELQVCPVRDFYTHAPTGVWVIRGTGGLEIMPQVNNVIHVRVAK